MARILFVVPRFHTNLFFATRALVEAGHEVSIFAAAQGEIEDHSHVQPAVLGKTPSRAEISERLASIAPDLILLRYAGDLSRQIYREARRRKLRVLGYDLRPLTQRRGWRKRLSFWSQKRVWERVTPVPGLDPEAPKDKAAHFLPWPVAAADLPASAYRDQTSEPVRVLCVGKLAQARKRQDALIAALEPLADHVQLTLVGATDRNISGADETHFAALKAAEARCDWITIRADVPFARMPEIYAAHHICVLPSEGEPLGVAPLEAMAYGTIPVIAQDAGSAGYLTQGQDGVRVDMSDPYALPRVMAALTHNAELRQKLCAGARRLAETELSPERFVARVEALL
ncbi:glycosyltransferase family 4 protein [Marivita sp. GX14005]|uniref:glycosyltransferase family 4 protein n=1 Tax=Marivita sp. GX14005 TaxID=2942276 RepID=UPI00201907B7|nr:glycosyltransferase family 4 protein [Marivita sp. GX14005]MCL3881148.1 glycosyltransferase family 4 protein [Marivita sp. GX14005]